MSARISRRERRLLSKILLFLSNQMNHHVAAIVISALLPKPSLEPDEPPRQRDRYQRSLEPPHMDHRLYSYFVQGCSVISSSPAALSPQQQRQGIPTLQM